MKRWSPSKKIVINWTLPTLQTSECHFQAGRNLTVADARAAQAAEFLLLLLPYQIKARMTERNNY
jgi:hypothetical protein